MKKFKSLIAVAIMLVSAMPMFAQFANSGNGTTSSTTEFPAKYGVFSVGYDYNTLKYDYKDADDQSTNGVAVQYTSGINIMQTKPLYFEWGVRASLGFWSESEDEDDYYEYEEKLTTLNLTVPLNIAYRLSVGDGIAITPYTGLHLKGNLLASLKCTETAGSHSESETLNLFDKKDMGKDYQWKRFQFGWQIGARVSYNKFNIGLEYGLDFNEICKKCKTSNFMVSVGLDI